MEQITSWHSFPKVYALGHRAINELCLDSIVVEEKIDGSQFSFGIFNGELKVRSKGQELNIDLPEKMFIKAVESVKGLDLKDGWTYRAEYLMKPKHNTLAYDRMPDNHLIVFDINDTQEGYLPYDDKAKECERIGLEVVPKVFEGMLKTPDQLKGYLDSISILGGQSIEGVVVKNYSRFGQDKKVLMGKYVSEQFKEKHNKEWKKGNPTNKDIVEEIISIYSTEVRWHKAIQHLRDSGQLTNTPSDIAFLMKEVSQDIKSECEEELKEMLFKWAWGKVSRGVVRGLPQWYKDQLLEDQFK